MTIGRLTSLRAVRGNRQQVSPWLQALLLASPAAITLWAIEPRLFPHSGWVWLQAGLAAWVCIAGWDILRKGLCELCFHSRVTQDGLAALAALSAMALSFNLAVLSSVGRLPIDVGGTMTAPDLLFTSVASILVARLLGKDLAERWRLPSVEWTQTESARILPPRIRTLFTLCATVCVGAAVFACAFSASLTPYNTFVATIAMLAGLSIEGVELTLWRGRLRKVWQAAAQTDAVLFEKSGVLTAGRPTVSSIVPLREGVTEERIGHLATVAEYGVDHPLRDALLRLPHAQSQTIPSLKHRENLPDKGIVAEFSGQRLLFGNLRLLEHSGWKHKDLERLSEATRSLWEQGDTVLFVCLGNEALGAIAFRDAIRPAAVEALAALHTIGIETGVISGDIAQSSAAMARRYHLTHLYAGFSDGKVEEQLQHLEAAGKTVAVVRLAGALGIDNLRISFRLPKRTDEESLEFEAVSAEDVTHRIIQSRLTVRRRRQRLLAFAAYHALVLPLLCGAYYPWIGFPASPSFAAWMSVAVTWLLLRPTKFDRLTSLG
jgi:cation transport ATPase